MARHSARLIFLGVCLLPAMSQDMSSIELKLQSLMPRGVVETPEDLLLTLPENLQKASSLRGRFISITPSPQSPNTLPPAPHYLEPPSQVPARPPAPAPTIFPNLALSALPKMTLHSLGMEQTPIVAERFGVGLAPDGGFDMPLEVAPPMPSLNLKSTSPLFGGRPTLPLQPKPAAPFQPVFPSALEEPAKQEEPEKSELLHNKDPYSLESLMDDKQMSKAIDEALGADGESPEEGLGLIPKPTKRQKSRHGKPVRKSSGDGKFGLTHLVQGGTGKRSKQKSGAGGGGAAESYDGSDDDSKLTESGSDEDRPDGANDSTGDEEDKKPPPHIPEEDSRMPEVELGAMKPNPPKGAYVSNGKGGVPKMPPPPAPPGYFTVDIAEGRSQHGMTIFRDHLIVFGGMDAKGTLLNDVWDYSLEDMQWRGPWNNLGDNISLPFGRANFSMYVLNNKLYVFGGKIFDDTTNSSHIMGDTFSFHFDMSEWEKVIPPDERRTHPRPRESYASWVDAAGRFWVHGGMAISSLMDDCMYMEPERRGLWSSPTPPIMDPKLKSPSRRYGHQMVLIDNSKVYVFGGAIIKLGELQYTNDLKYLDKEGMLWREAKMSAKSQKPKERAWHTVAFKAYIWVFGGTELICNKYGFQCYDKPLGDLWGFDIGLRQWFLFGDKWEEKDPPGPSARYLHKAAMHNGNWYVHGGQTVKGNKTKVIPELWKWITGPPGVGKWAQLA